MQSGNDKMREGGRDPVALNTVRMGHPGSAGLSVTVRGVTFNEYCPFLPVIALGRPGLRNHSVKACGPAYNLCNDHSFTITYTSHCLRPERSVCWSVEAVRGCLLLGEAGLNLALYAREGPPHVLSLSPEVLSLSSLQGYPVSHRMALWRVGENVVAQAWAEAQD